MLPAITMPATDRRRSSRLALTEIAAVMADAFDMVPVQGRRGHWRSGHYELWFEREPPALHLRFRSVERQSFHLTLASAPAGGLTAVVTGVISDRGYQDLVVADERLGGVILHAACPPTFGMAPMLPLELVDVLTARRPRGASPAASTAAPG